MNIEKYTDRVKGFIQSAQSLALREGHQQFTAEHLLKVLLDDPEGLEAECREGRAFGFDGKSLIHPNQIEAANRLFGPSDAEVEAARRLIATATGGAERYEGEMIERMHVEQARFVLARARQSA